MDRSQAPRLPRPGKVRITDACTGCRYCMTEFECPALLYDEEGKRTHVDAVLCTGCGVCLHVCPLDAIREAAPEGKDP
jgi:indolepyruvate ferredoxin oxidoreductase alpha subunit